MGLAVLFICSRMVCISGTFMSRCLLHHAANILCLSAVASKFKNFNVANNCDLFLSWKVLRCTVLLQGHLYKSFTELVTIRKFIQLQNDNS